MSLINYQFPHLFSAIADTNIAVGVITSIDRANNKADVYVDALEDTLSSIDIFYHCDNTGSTVQGHCAFDIGDSVYIFNPTGKSNNIYGDPFTKMRIIGHVDGALHSCDIRFALRIIRADGTTIDDSWFTDFRAEVDFYNSSHGEIGSYNVLRTYDGTYHHFRIRSDQYDPDGYFIRCYGEGMPYWGTMYPNTYKISEWFNSGCIIQPGTYTFNVAYFETESILEETSGGYQYPGGQTVKGRTVYSSVPYEVIHTAAFTHSICSGEAYYALVFKVVATGELYCDNGYQVFCPNFLNIYSFEEGDVIDIDYEYEISTGESTTTEYGASLGGRSHVMTLTNTAPETFIVHPPFGGDSYEIIFLYISWARGGGGYCACIKDTPQQIPFSTNITDPASM